MSSPFPGMDPFLEDAEHWRGFHNLLAAEMLRRLNPLLVPKYYADIEVHEALEDVVIGRTHRIFPDVAILERQPEVVPQQQIPPTTATVEAQSPAPLHSQNSSSCALFGFMKQRPICWLRRLGFFHQRTRTVKGYVNTNANAHGCYALIFI